MNPLTASNHARFAHRPAPASAPQRGRRGFSLPEIMVVLLILGLLATVVSVNVRSHLIKAKKQTARTEMVALGSALEAYWQDHNTYPDPSLGLTILLQPQESTGEAYLSGADLLDPWNHPYAYLMPGREGKAYEIVCFGADGQEGGDGADEDLVHTP